MNDVPRGFLQIFFPKQNRVSFGPRAFICRRVLYDSEASLALYRRQFYLPIPFPRCNVVRVWLFHFFEVENLKFLRCYLGIGVLCAADVLDPERRKKNHQADEVFEIHKIEQVGRDVGFYFLQSLFQQRQFNRINVPTIDNRLGTLSTAF